MSRAPPRQCTVGEEEQPSLRSREPRQDQEDPSTGSALFELEQKRPQHKGRKGQVVVADKREHRQHRLTSLRRKEARIVRIVVRHEIKPARILIEDPRRIHEAARIGCGQRFG